MRSVIDGIPGFLLVAVLALSAVLLAQYFGFSETFVAILLGFVVGNLWPVPASMRTGVQWVECQGLSIAVALLGVQLNAAILLQINGTTLAFIAVALLFTLTVTLLLAKLWQLKLTQACLLASGQAICGSAAIMATQNIVKAPGVQVGLTVALVNFLGFLGVFMTTWMIHLFNFEGATDAGFMIGNTLQSMGHVVAAGFGINDDVGHAAVLIKMCRILFLIPVLLVIIYIMNRAKQKAADVTKTSQIPIHWLRLVPLFIWAFLFLSFISSMDWVPLVVQSVLKQISDIMFVLAMVAIGLGIRIKDLWQQGRRLLVLGGLVFILQLGFTVAFLLYF